MTRATGTNPPPPLVAKFLEHCCDNPFIGTQWSTRCDAALPQLKGALRGEKPAPLAKLVINHHLASQRLTVESARELLARCATAEGRAAYTQWWTQTFTLPLDLDRKIAVAEANLAADGPTFDAVTAWLQGSTETIS